MCGTLDNLSKAQSQHLENYKRLLGDNINEMDNVIYNLFRLTKGNDSPLNSLYKNKENKYDNIISNNQNLKSNSIWTYYLYLYNRLSILINNIIKSNSKNNIKQLKILSKK